MTLLHDISQDSNSCAFTPNSRTYIICRQAYLGNELLADVPFHSKRHYNGRIACGYIAYVYGHTGQLFGPYITEVYRWKQCSYRKCPDSDTAQTEERNLLSVVHVLLGTSYIMIVQSWLLCHQVDDSVEWRSGQLFWSGDRSAATVIAVSQSL